MAAFKVRKCSQMLSAQVCSRSRRVLAKLTNVASNSDWRSRFKQAAHLRTSLLLVPSQGNQARSSDVSAMGLEYCVELCIQTPPRVGHHREMQCNQKAINRNRLSPV
ncbi:hypothetical protein QE440_000922 [Pseudomonas psychrotolerans]|uniref:Uncharacterized protein n=1 Tax=Pseudomonas oryzihabitans TaxID=47885 RepID=A0AAJ2BKY9_9PSED|nr:hypothetical protein [Pseudomonas psychrotolerans]